MPGVDAATEAEAPEHHALVVARDAVAARSSSSSMPGLRVRPVAPRCRQRRSGDDRASLPDRAARREGPRGFRGHRRGAPSARRYPSAANDGAVRVVSVRAVGGRNRPTSRATPGRGSLQQRSSTTSAPANSRSQRTASSSPATRYSWRVPPSAHIQRTSARARRWWGRGVSEIEVAVDHGRQVHPRPRRRGGARG